MKIIKPSYEILTPINREEILKTIEVAGRTCYKSESKITEDSASKFATMLIKRGHDAMIEHYNVIVKFICDRAISHEIVRHRIASYAQESTRYVNYIKRDMKFIVPIWFGGWLKKCAEDEQVINIENVDEFVTDFIHDITPSEEVWLRQIISAEETYSFLIEQHGWKPEQARSVLPNSLKTEIVVTMNLREWRHFFKLRTANTAHPQMREIAIPLLNDFKRILPEIFGNIEVK